MHTCIHTHTHTYTHTHIHTYTHTCIHIHACTHTQTYKHTNDSFTHASLSYVPFTISCLFPPFPFYLHLSLWPIGKIDIWGYHGPLVYIFSGYDYDIHLIHTLDRRPQSGQCYGLELEPPTATSNRASIFKNVFHFKSGIQAMQKLISRSKLWLCIIGIGLR